MTRVYLCLLLFLSFDAYADKALCDGTPTQKLIESIAAEPGRFFLPKGVRIGLDNAVIEASDAGGRTIEWREAEYTKRAVTTQLYVHAAVEIKGKLLYVEAESAAGRRVAVETKADLTTRVLLRQFPEDGNSFLDPTGRKATSTEKRPLFLQCSITAELAKEGTTGLVSRTKVGGGFHAGDFGRAGVAKEVEIERAGGGGRGRSCNSNTFWIRLPPGTYGTRFGREVCAEFTAINGKSVLEDRARMVQGDLAYLDRNSTCSANRDCIGKVRVETEVRKLLGARAQLPIHNPFQLRSERFPDRRAEILERQSAYDLAYDHLAGADGAAYPACVRTFFGSFRCGLALREGAVCFRTPLLGAGVSVSAATERLHQAYVDRRWYLPCGRGLICYAGRCRTPFTVRLSLGRNREIPEKVRRAILDAESLPELEIAVDQVPAKATPEFRVLEGTKTKLVEARKRYHETFAARTRPHQTAISDPAALLRSHFFSPEMLLREPDKGGIAPPRGKGRPETTAFFPSGRTELEEILDGLVSPIR